MTNRLPIRFRLPLGIGIAIATTTSAVATDCKPAHDFKTIAPGTLTVTTFEFQPYTTVAEDGSFAGVEGDVIKRIAAKECLAVKSVSVDPAAVIQYVLAGQADVATGDWYRTADRNKVLGLSAPLYLDQMGLFSKDGLSTVTSIIGKKVGTVQGYLWVTDLQKVLGSSLHIYPNPVALAQDLAAGRIDVGIDSYAVGVVAQRKGGYPGIQIKVADPDERVRASVQPGQAAFPYTKTNEALGAALDADIVDLHKDGDVGQILSAHGLAASAGDVGEPRLVK